MVRVRSEEYKECHRARERARYHANKDSAKDKNRIWRETNDLYIRQQRKLKQDAMTPEEKAVKAIYNAKYRILNIEQEKDRRRKQWLENKEQMKATAKVWREANKEKHLAYARDWAASNPGRHNANGHAYRARKLKAPGRFFPSDIQVLWEDQGGICAGINCDRPLSESCTVDHIQPITRGGTNWPVNLQLMCQSCNSRKSNRTMQEWRATLAA